MDEIISLGLWIKRRRKALDLTQDALAGLIGCALGTIKKIETDERRPSRQLAERLASCLRLPPEERAAFIQAARAELAADRLAAPTQSVVPAQFTPTIHAAPSAGAHLPSGTVTFLFTDIQGSTQLWELQRAVMPSALARHNAILHAAITVRGGAVFKTVGDSICAVFVNAPQALAATLDAQRALAAEPWETIEPLRVRMALHTGTAEIHDGEYMGLALSRVARLLDLAHGGQVLLSLATQELVRNHLPVDVALRDLGAQRLKDLTRPEQIFQLIAPDLPTEFPRLHTLDARPTNLPAQPTALIGREREIAEVTALLRRDDVRLLTLTGPGGTGKTRLALQAAAELCDETSPPRLPQRERGPVGEGHFPDGVWFVNLAPIADAGLVATTIAHALGLVEAAGKPIEESLRAFLRAKQMLLLLDNFEQVIDAARLIAALLAAAPGLKVLATSRVILHLYGEHEYTVPPLTLPPTTDDHAADRRDIITQYESVRLFLARAQATKPGFAITNDNAPAVAEICHRLDGLPLAIELAAARIKLFPPDTLLARLGSRLQVLTGGARDLPARQQTLRNTIEWSYNLLDQGEQALFRRLGVFVGGCTLEAAETVCRLQGTGYREQEIDAEEPASLSPVPCNLSPIDGLAALVDQNLLRQEEGADGEPRIVMLETVREYSLERLAASGELEVMRRHAEYFMALAEAAEPALKSHQQVAWLDRLEGELNNVRAALDWGLRSGEMEMAARLGSAIWRFWELRDHQYEGLGWLERLLIHDDVFRHEVKAKALAAVAKLHWWNKGNNVQAQALCRKSMTIFARIDNQSGLAGTLVDLGGIVSEMGDYGESAMLLEQGLALFRALGDAHGIAWALLRMGRNAKFQRDFATARTCSEESLALMRVVGDPQGIAWSLFALSDTNLSTGNYAAALEQNKERLEIEQALHHKTGISKTLSSLGTVALAQGDYATAHAYFEESLAVGQEIAAHVITPLVTGLGTIAFAEKDYATARRRFEESLEQWRHLEDSNGIAWALLNLGIVAREEDDPWRATALFAESLSRHRDSGDRDGVVHALYWLVSAAASQSQQTRVLSLFTEIVAVFQEIHELRTRAMCVSGLALVALAQVNPEQATRLCAAAETGIESMRHWSIGRWVIQRAEYKRTIAAIRAQIEEPTFAAAWAEGQKLTLEQAIAEALAGSPINDGASLDAKESSM